NGDRLWLLSSCGACCSSCAGRWPCWRWCCGRSCGSYRCRSGWWALPSPRSSRSCARCCSFRRACWAGGRPRRSACRGSPGEHTVTSTSDAVSVCGHCLPGHPHICAFVDSTDEQYRILNPYFREGLAAGDEVVTIVESTFHDEHRERMRAGGVGVDAALASGHLKLLASEDTYADGGVFVAD